MANPVKIDTLLEARWIIPVEPAGVGFARSCHCDRSGDDPAVIPSAEAQTRFVPSERIVLSNHALIPGLVNLHIHAAMSLMRGLADDLPLADWLNEHIWPAEARHVDSGFVFDGTRLACAEMLKGGDHQLQRYVFLPGSIGSRCAGIGNARKHRHDCY